MSDPFIVCPYNAAHRVPRSRIQGHIVKCEKKYPKLAICPYNATHRMPESEIKDHVTDCVSKVVVDENKTQSNVIFYKPMPKPLCQTNPKPNDEDYECWD